MKTISVLSTSQQIDLTNLKLPRLTKELFNWSGPVKHPPRNESKGDGMFGRY